MKRQVETAPSYTAQVLSIIREQILKGTYAPGQRLYEAELAEKLGTSRSPVREAFQRLASEGLVRLVPNRGAFVFTLSPAEMEELLEVREILELAAVELAAKRGTKEQLARLRTIVETTDDTIRKQEYYPRDINFHLQVFESAGNAKLSAIYTDVNTQIRLAQTLSVSDLKRAHTARDEHLPILEALEHRDAEGAKQAMKVHLERAGDSILTVFASE